MVAQNQSTKEEFMLSLFMVNPLEEGPVLLRSLMSQGFLSLHSQETNMKSRCTLVTSLVQGQMLMSSSISLESMETQVMGLNPFSQALFSAAS